MIPLLSEQVDPGPEQLRMLPQHKLNTLILAQEIDIDSSTVIQPAGIIDVNLPQIIQLIEKKKFGIFRITSISK